jgi:hypothetical protein
VSFEFELRRTSPRKATRFASSTIMYSTYQFAPKRSSVSQFNPVVENEL